MARFGNGLGSAGASFGGRWHALGSTLGFSFSGSPIHTPHSRRTRWDRDGAGWKFLANDTTPGYTDTFPLPASPAKWKYRAIWRLDDKQIGLWSNVVSINVG